MMFTNLTDIFNYFLRSYMYGLHEFNGYRWLILIISLYVMMFSNLTDIQMNTLAVTDVCISMIRSHF